MGNNQCDSFVLADFLSGDVKPDLRKTFESHLENCESCQQQLADLAADPSWRTKASAHLQSQPELKLPKTVSARLADSGSFIIRTLVGDTSSHSVSRQESDWQKILDPPADPDRLGCIDQFDIDSKIGQGGMGIVLKGFDRQLNRAVAIKVLAPHLASNESSRQRFSREAQAAAAVVHPNVIPIYAVESESARPYIVMQLIPGHSLQSLVKTQGPLTPEEVVQFATQIADGLDAAHKQGLIHRDIKPANVLVDEDGNRAVITDFGLARAADDAGLTQTGWIAGTPHYMSPEQASGDPLDGRSDLFSLGAVMYFLATGKEPFQGEKPFAVIQKIINEPAKPAKYVNDDLPPMLSDIIEKLLEKDRAHRFQSAHETKELLQRYLEYLQTPDRAIKPARILTRRQRRKIKTWSVSALVGIAVLCVAIGVIKFRPVATMTPSVAQNATITLNSDGTPSPIETGSDPQSTPDTTSKVEDIDSNDRENNNTDNPDTNNSANNPTTADTMEVAANVAENENLAKKDPVDIDSGEPSSEDGAADVPPSIEGADQQDLDTEKPAAQPGYRSFFSDDALVKEIRDVGQAMASLEHTMRQPNPFEPRLMLNSEPIDMQLIDEMQQLNKSMERLQQHEHRQIELLKTWLQNR